MWQSLGQLKGKGGAGTTLLAGNWGLNSVLGSPSPEEPIRLYSEDVDGNGNPETLLTYVRQGREITVADKDELTASIPSLKRNQLNYTDYAAKAFTELFSKLKNPPQTVSTLEHLRLTRRNGSNWTAESLPRATQITTLNCSLEIPQGILLGGNKMEVQPRIGRQDAAALQLLRPDGTVGFVDLGGERNRLEVRQLVRLDDGHVLVLVAGGEHLILDI
jgi:antitoxin (DNA-binding transcriptional repressor) of toxin-antitoxin stability system